MGRFKLLLQWGDDTVIGCIVRTLEAAGLEEIIVVTGYRAGEVVAALQSTRARMVDNPDFETGEMLSSVQVGLRAVGAGAHGVLLCLGDQPQMEVATVQAVTATAQAEDWTRVVVPSFELRSGHPIFLPRGVWPDVFAASSTLKDALAQHRTRFSYVIVESASILDDLDTPQQYARAKVAADGKHLRSVG